MIRANWGILLLLAAQSCASPSPSPSEGHRTSKEIVARISGLILADLSDQARLEAEEAARARPDDDQIQALWGKLLAESCRVEEGLKILDRAVQRSGDPRIRMMRGTLRYELRKDMAGALEDYDEGLRSAPDATAYLNRGVIYLSRGALDKARSDYERALELNPRYSLALHNYGDCLIELGEVSEGIKFLDRCLQMKPDFVPSLIRKADALRELRRSQEAAEIYTRALELAPTNMLALTRRGQTYAELGQHEKAVADYDRAVQVNPSDADVYALRFESDLVLKQDGKALADIGEVIRLAPASQRGWRLRAVYWLNKDEFQKALEDSEKAVQLAPRNANAYLCRGGAYSGLQKYEEAIRDLTKAIELDPADSEAFYFRGRARKKAGDLMGANADRLRSELLERMEKPGPEAAFLRAMDSASSENWKLFVSCFNPRRRDRSMRKVMEMATLMMSGSKTDLKEFSAFLRKEGVEIGDDGDLDTASFRDVKSVPEFAISVMDFASSHSVPGTKLIAESKELTELSIHGDRASAVALTKDGKKEVVNFALIDGRWYLDP